MLQLEFRQLVDAMMILMYLDYRKWASILSPLPVTMCLSPAIVMTMVWVNVYITSLTSLFILQPEDHRPNVVHTYNHR